MTPHQYPISTRASASHSSSSANSSLGYTSALCLPTLPALPPPDGVPAVAALLGLIFLARDAVVASGVTCGSRRPQAVERVLAMD